MFEGDLPPACFADVLAAARVQAFPAGRVIFKQGDPPGACYLVLSGYVGLYLEQGQAVQMLQEQKADIIAASQEQTTGLLRGLDEKYEQRFLKVEQGCDGLLGKVSTMDSRLTRVEELLRSGAGVASTGDGGLWMRNANSLWFLEGGIRTPSVESLSLRWRRRLTALTFAGTWIAVRLPLDPADRLLFFTLVHELAKPVTSHGKKMWVALSRSKQERDVSGHCSWLKRTLASFGQSHVDGLDVEYSSGTSWMGDHMVASSTRTPPVTGQDGDLVWDDRKVWWTFVLHLMSTSADLFMTVSSPW
eukprot:s3680_g2.t1